MPAIGSRNGTGTYMRSVALVNPAYELLITLITLFDNNERLY